MKKNNIACLYLSSAIGVFYGIFKRGQRQVKKSLKTTDKELACRWLKDVRQKVARLNTKEGCNATFADFADRWLGTIWCALQTIKQASP